MGPFQTFNNIELKLSIFKSIFNLSLSLPVVVETVWDMIH